MMPPPKLISESVLTFFAFELSQVSAQSHGSFLHRCTEDLGPQCPRQGFAVWEPLRSKTVPQTSTDWGFPQADLPSWRVFSLLLKIKKWEGALWVEGRSRAPPAACLHSVTVTAGHSGSQRAGLLALPLTALIWRPSHIFPNPACLFLVCFFK